MPIYPPPKLLGWPEAKIAKSKSRFSAGKRRCWRLLDGRLMEWDYLHGTLEMYHARGKHLGEYDPESGCRIGGPVPGRGVEP